MTNYEIHAKEKSGCRGGEAQGDHPGPGSHAETGRMSGHQHGKEAHCRANNTNQGQEQGWHFQGILRIEDEGTQEAVRG